MLFSDPSFNAIQGILGAISKSQSITTSNVANAQTPGYTAKSAEFSDVLFGAQNPFETNMSAQFGNSLINSASVDTGKPVTIQHELVTMQKNMMLYNMATRRLNSMISAIRTASQAGR